MKAVAGYLILAMSFAAHANSACQHLLVPTEMESFASSDQAFAFMDSWDETKFSKAKSNGSFGMKFPLAKGLLDSSGNYGQFKSKLSDIKRKTNWTVSESQSAWYVHKELPAHLTQGYVACLTATPLALRIVSGNQVKDKFMVELSYHNGYNGNVPLDWVHDNVENAAGLPTGIAPKSARTLLVRVQNPKEPVLLGVNSADGGTARVEYVPNVSDETVKGLEKALAEYTQTDGGTGKADGTGGTTIPPVLYLGPRLLGGATCFAQVSAGPGSIAGGLYRVWHAHGRAMSQGPHTKGGAYSSRVFVYPPRADHVNIFGVEMRLAQDNTISLASGEKKGTLTCP